MLQVRLKIDYFDTHTRAGEKQTISLVGQASHLLIRQFCCTVGPLSGPP